MTIAEIEQLIHLLRTNGVSRFESKAVSLRFGEAKAVGIPVQASTELPGPPIQAIPPVSNEIPHHANEVLGLLKLKDEDLVDRLFPDLTREAEDAVS